MILGILAGGLLLVPVFVTVGIHLGVENQKLMALIQGKPPPGTIINPSTGGYIPRIIATEQFCQKAYGFEPFPYRYLYNPNQWGDTQNTGSLCLDITTDNGVDAKDQYAFNWTATWTYPQGPEDEPVHAFPNALLNDTSLPMQLGSLTNLTLDVAWTYAVGNVAASKSDDTALNAANLQANAAIDMFLSNDQTTANSSTLATHEVMIWFGVYGNSARPLGYPDVTATEVINGVSFELYAKQNAQLQYVFTWLATNNTATFSGDLTPFFTKLSTYTGAPTSNTYLGYVAFGSEVFYATGGNMTFSVPKMYMSVNGN